MMTTGRDSFLMRKSTLLTIHVHFSAFQKYNKALAVPLSWDRNTANHHYRTADTALMAPYVPS